MGKLSNSKKNRRKRLVREVLHYFGFDLIRVDKQRIVKGEKIPFDVDENFIHIFKSNPYLGGYTVKLYTTYKAVEYVVKNNIKGDFIECGVFEGREIIMMLLTLQKLGDQSRDIYLYDTFAGMTKPGVYDEKKHRNFDAQANLKKWESLQRGTYNEYTYCPLEKTKEYVYSTGYPQEKIHFIKGDILKTIPNDFHKEIAILRIDVDWYESTKHGLKHLFPILSKEGIFINDDYGSWAGARKAIDEYFKEISVFPFLARTEETERVYLKT